MRRIFLCLTLLSCTSILGFAQLTNSIFEIQGQQFASPLVGLSVTTTGIVTANNVTSGTSGVIGYFIQDGEGPWNGIFVYDSTQAPEIGDEVIIEGEVSEFYDLTQLDNVSYFEILSQGNAVPTPSLVTTGELASSEAYEGCLVRVVNALCVNPDADYGEAIFDDGSGEVKTNDIMYLPEGGWIQDEYYSITGCIHYTFEEYKIEPRYAEDICEFPSFPNSCFGNCVNDADSDGVCDEDEILGCTDSEALNYNSAATDSSETCVYTCSLSLDVVTVDPPICPGSDDGAIAVVAEGEQLGVQFSIDSILPFTSSAWFLNVGEGVYTVFAIDGVGCEASVEVEVNIPSPTNINIISIGDDINGSNNGFIYVNVYQDGLWSNFEFTWSGPNGFYSQNQNITNLAAGFYTLDVYDALGCITTLDVEVPASMIEIIGCLDVSAINYDAAANIDSDNCFYHCGDDNVGDGGYLYDNQVPPFHEVIEISEFNDQLFLDTTTTGLYVKMEHSYMHDLTIKFTCPNGQFLTVHDQGGGSVNLGIPDQGDGTGVGVGWNYIWAPNAMNGTWIDNADNATATNNQLPPGTYESVQPFSLLEGCPLNGNWEIEIQDHLAADDGYLFEWGLVLDSCSLPCNDIDACNYSEASDAGGGSCEYPDFGYDCSGNCISDINSDGSICDDNILFYEDFANGFDGNNGIGSWTAEDSGEGLIWQHVNQVGDGYYFDGSASGAQPPAGEYSTNIGPLNSTTAANGWMIFDNDFYNTPIAEGVENTEGWITSPSLDFSASGSVIITWEQYFRYCCYPYAPLYLQASNDGGVNWTTFDAHGTFIESANTASANALTTSVDISCVAANSADVQIRFSYLQAPETGDGYSHYYWGIDDIRISQNSIEDDLTAVQLTNGDINEGWEYRVTPIEQAIAEADGGLLAGLVYQNSGNSDQDETTVFIEVLDEVGNVLSTTSEYLGTVNSLGNSVNCPANLQDTIYVATGWTPSEIGNYVLRATIESVNDDETPEDNTLNKVIIYSDHEYGHDDEANLDVEFAPDPATGGIFNPSGYGNYYSMANEGSVAFGLAVRFGPNSGGGDLEFETRLYENDFSGGLVDAPFESAFWVYDDAWTPESASSSEYVYLPFENPIELGTVNAYFAAVINEFESEAQLTVLGNADSDTDNSAGNYNLTGGVDFGWSTSQTSTPAIRLIMSPEPFVVSGCENSEACNYDPNANEDDGSCTYPGCLDMTATNYDSDAGCADECSYLAYDCTSVGDGAWDYEEIGLYPDFQDAMVGVSWSGDWVFNIPGMVIEPQSGVEYGVHHVDWDSVNGLPNWIDNAEFTTGYLDASSQHCIAASGVPSESGIHELTASGEVFISIFGSEFSIGQQTYSAWLEVFENPNPILGCMYPLASNFLPYATTENGSCVFFGCTDPDAADFNPFANIDDGSCGEGCNPIQDSSCATDVNYDGAVNVSDLLLLLGEFGTLCE